MDCAVSSGSDEDGSASAEAPSPQSASSAGSVPTHAAVNAASTASVGRESWEVVIWVLLAGSLPLTEPFATWRWWSALKEVVGLSRTTIVYHTIVVRL